MFVGVDGCRAGWIAVSKTGGRGLEYKVFAKMNDLLEHYDEAQLVLVDIPIGLPWKKCPKRPCDVFARTKLRTRASSVFPVPCREATRAPNVDEARRRNMAELGCSLSEQAWGICKKIAEVDELLLANTRARAIVREVHPEVCFWSLNGEAPMTHAKRRPQGIRERIDLLAGLEPGTQILVDEAMTNEFRRDVQADDVLDALVAYVIARSGLGALKRLSGSPPSDEHGLPMEMLYF